MDCAGRGAPLVGVDMVTLRTERAQVADRARSLRREVDALAEQQALTSYDDEHDPGGRDDRGAAPSCKGCSPRPSASATTRGSTGSACGTGGPIAAERLEALPATTTCITCASGPRPRW